VSSRRSLGHFKDRRWLLRALEWFVNRRTALVIANSEAVRLDTLRREGLAPSTVIVIHNGFPGDRAAAGNRGHLRQALGVAETAPVAIAVANLIYYKAHDVLVDAWRRVVATVPDAMLWMVGEGPERDRIREAIGVAELSSQVRMLGTRTDVADLLAAADVLVHPSREEGFSNALLEAMAAGLPVVAADVGGNTEAVVCGATGLLVLADDAAALAAATIRLFVDRDLAHRYGAAGRERVAQHFSETRMIEAYDQVYRRLARREG
jgi:glycosyltransferase involved in cell wall biosynthesis